jgi:outer membrane protein TolC
VRTAIRAVIANYKQIDVNERARSYAEERLKAYMKKVEVGLATNKDLLDVENDLVTAKTNLIKARAAYEVALRLLWRANGELLEKEGIVMDTGRVDELYRGAR